MALWTSFLKVHATAYKAGGQGEVGWGAEAQFTPSCCKARTMSGKTINQKAEESHLKSQRNTLGSKHSSSSREKYYIPFQIQVIQQELEFLKKLNLYFICFVEKGGRVVQNMKGLNNFNYSFPLLSIKLVEFAFVL